MWPFYQKPKLKRDSIDIFELRVMLNGGYKVSFNLSGKGLTINNVYYEFLNWFLQKRTKNYKFEYNGGINIFVRSEIMNIELRKIVFSPD